MGFFADRLQLRGWPPRTPTTACVEVLVLAGGSLFLASPGAVLWLWIDCLPCHRMHNSCFEWLFGVGMILLEESLIGVLIVRIFFLGSILY